MNQPTLFGAVHAPPQSVTYLDEMERPTAAPAMSGTAEIVDGGVWRTLLTRQWSEGPQVAFVMLNPSDANAVRTDPTLTRCIGFARSWGMGGLRIANLWSMVQSDPSQLWRWYEADPGGRDRP